MRTEQGRQQTTDAKRNLLHKIVDRLIGNVPKIQKRKPSILIIGKTNLVVKVERINPTTARFMKPIIVIHPVKAVP